MPSPLWTLSNISLAGSGLPRLDSISLEIHPGVTAILGPSGAGKTSLLNLLVAYERPDEGTLLRSDSTPHSSLLTPHSLPVYWVPQSGGLWPHLTAQEHLRLVIGAKAEGAGPLTMLESFDLAEKMDSRPDELSQGERARLAVARALMADAAVLVMDEPFANVDLARVGRYWAVVRRRIAETGASLVFATHSPEAVLAEAGRVVCLTEGRLLYEGSVADLYWRPRTREEADCLGENNWLTPEEARVWLGREEEAPRCFRPEQIAVEISDFGFAISDFREERPAGSAASIRNPKSEIRNGPGPLVVQSSRFKGSVAEVELRHEGPEADGLKPALRTRRFVHRPVGDALKAGMRVVLRALVGQEGQSQ
ncbi:MAG: ATP-binding cassette domain-containing protein [Planctomycetes bacterium]|nr:ATP-binding cassette domain-containing protein [Planctomycetota bacterium]